MCELLSVLLEHAERGRVALVEALDGEPEREITYRALAGHACLMGEAMHALGIRPGDCVTVLSKRPARLVIAILAGLANGIVVNPLNPALPSAMRRALLQHAQPRVLITDDDPPDLADAPAHTRAMTWNELFESPTAKGAPAPYSTWAGDAGGLLIYTSGTTGTPKGVLLRWRHIRANVLHAIAALGYSAQWVAGSLLPRFHTFTLISDILPALFLGGKAVLVDTFDLRHVQATVDAFKRHGVLSYSAAPVILQTLCVLRAWEGAAVPLRFAVAGAAPLSEKTRLDYQRAFGHPIIPCYGLSETTCFAAISPPHAIRPGAVGLPAGIEVRVVDERGAALPPDCDGELAMRGPSVITGYHDDRQERHAQSFIADSGWFLSGDIGRIDADGYIHVTGRKKNMVIRGGEKVYLEDVDRCLAGLDGVADVASVVKLAPGAPDAALTFVVAAPGIALERAAIVRRVRAQLTERHVPDRIHFVTRIPRTSTGKVSQPELLALAAALEAEYCL